MDYPPNFLFKCKCNFQQYKSGCVGVIYLFCYNEEFENRTMGLLKHLRLLFVGAMWWRFRTHWTEIRLTENIAHVEYLIILIELNVFNNSSVL